MHDWQEADKLVAFTPLVICGQLLTALWQHASEESEQPAALFEDWMQEVSNWAGLIEWQASLKEKLHFGENLWLPSMNEHELTILLGIINLANALGSPPVQLAQALLRLPQVISQQSISHHQGMVTQPHQREIGNAFTPAVALSEQDERRIEPVIEKDVDYQPLIDALSKWQAVFELALDEAATYLDKELFPAQDLQKSLSEMCDLLRDVLLKCSSPAQTERETI